MRLYRQLLVAAAAMTVCMAQTIHARGETAHGDISGTVIDSASGEPVVGATVALKGLPDSRVRTDSNGRYALSDVPAGDRAIIVFKSGYRIFEITAIRANQGLDAVVNVSLDPRTSERPEDKILSLATLVVEAEAIVPSESVRLGRDSFLD